MRYIRMKDGIFETGKTVLGKHTKIVLTNKKTGETISEIVCDYIEEKSIVEDMLFAEYCKTHKLNPLDYSKKTIVVNLTVLKQADSIYELCDEFIWATELSPQIIKMPKKLNKYQLEDIKNGMIVYGAIWTTGEYDEPILKAVAKLNKDGELELL